MKHASKLIVPLLAAIALAWGITAAQAASHREAPLIALDPSADNTDVYAFVSYDAANLGRAPADRTTPGDFRLSQRLYFSRPRVPAANKQPAG